MSETSQFLIYTAPNGTVKVDVFIKDETLWLTQKALAELFGVQRPAISGTLSTLASGDFRLAQAFQITARFKLVTEHGTLKGCVSLEQYQQHEFAIIRSEPN